MVTMTPLPQSRPLTAADLGTMPDDGHRYELVDGTLVVTPSPAVPHQRVVGNLHLALRAACPADLEVMLAPLDINVSDQTVLQPDLLVATRQALTGRRMTGLPVLAVEVLSPSTRLVDLSLKRAAYEVAGVTSYWVVDPDPVALTAWLLVDGAYEQQASVSAGGVFVTESPFDLSLDPADLIR